MKPDLLQMVLIWYLFKTRIYIHWHELVTILSSVTFKRIAFAKERREKESSIKAATVTTWTSNMDKEKQIKQCKQKHNNVIELKLTDLSVSRFKLPFAAPMMLMRFCIPAI